MQGGRVTTQSRDEVDAGATFRERYGRPASAATRELEQLVIGGDFGANGYTTVDLFRRDERYTSMTLAELVDGPEQVAPRPSDLDVDLVHVPSIPHEVLTGSGGLGELRGEPLDPPVDADVVDLDAAFGEKLFDVPVGKTEP
jgi:hypothetical protein